MLVRRISRWPSRPISPTRIILLGAIGGFICARPVTVRAKPAPTADCRNRRRSTAPAGEGALALEIWFFMGLFGRCRICRSCTGSVMRRGRGFKQLGNQGRYLRWELVAESTAWPLDHFLVVC